MARAAKTAAPPNKLFYGDNLAVLRDREHFPDGCVDLIYLDPPFNSKRDYNLLFKSPKGQQSEAQITAFEDSWHWGQQAEHEFYEIVHQSNTKVSELMQALRRFLRENDMMAYLTMMANRLLELHRVLKDTGSLYLHCDPTASHYLKIVLDGVFGVEYFKSEIIWKRTSAHSSSKRWGPVHDTILFATKNDRYTWHTVYQKYNEDYIDDFYRFVDNKGRFRVGDLTGAGVRHGASGQPWRDVNPTSVGRHWAVPNKILVKLFGDKSKDWTVQEKLDALDRKGLIHWPRKGSTPGFKRYFDPLAGVSILDVITDIDVIGSRADERLGYPTQKPLALLERIINASSNKGDVVLDPFCGCGTAVHAAQKLGRRWIGIDITHLAISLVEKRLKDAFKGKEKAGFIVYGTPQDIEGARDLANREKDKYQFQWWAVSLVEAQPYRGKVKGADSGIDGIKYFHDLEGDAKKILVSVKGGENIGVSMIRDLKGTMDREKAEIALFLTLTPPTRPMIQEAASAGVYRSDSGKTYARLQILTIEDLMSGKARAEHPDHVPDVNFKKARQERRRDRRSLFEGEAEAADKE